MVRRYIQARIKDDSRIAATREAPAGKSDVVPVALDLGIVMLRRAQEMSDPAARQAELEKAEKTFLAIRSAAGESDEYRLFLGQVYYWLGRHDEGRALFDELLLAKERNFETLLLVAEMLRQVGSEPEARTLAEEAYAATTEQVKKYQAAALRSLILRDVEDQIEWLRRAAPNDESTKVGLSWAMGRQALTEGRVDEAERNLREAVAMYDKPAETASSTSRAGIPNSRPAHCRRYWPFGTSSPTS